MKGKLLVKPQSFIKNNAHFILNPTIKNYYDMNKEEIEKMKEKKFRELLLYSVKYVPYYNTPIYKEFLAQYKGEYIKNLDKLPIITKSELQKNNALFWSKEKYRLSTFHGTSGTTGTPLKIKIFLKEKLKSMAALHTWYSKIGIQKGWNIILTGFMIPKNKSKEDYWIDYLDKTIYLSIYEIKKKNLSTYIWIFNKYKPTMIYGYPSSIYELSKIIATSKESIEVLNEVKPTVVTTSEVLEPTWRKSIEDYIGKVYDFYGSQEGAHLVTEFKDGKMYSHPYIGIIEAVNDKNERVYGQLGNAIVTSLNKKSMPLIRYEIGDVVSISKTKSGWEEVSNIGGRSEDLIRKADGSKVSLLNYHASRNISILRQSQIIQKSYELFEVHLSFEENVSIDSKSEAQKDFAREMKLRLDNSELLIDFKEVTEFNRGKNGKFKSVIVRDF